MDERVAATFSPTWPLLPMPLSPPTSQALPAPCRAACNAAVNWANSWARPISGAACSTTGALPCVVAGLTNGTSYSFKAYATNAVGTTYTSPVSTFTTLPSTNANLGALTVSAGTLSGSTTSLQGTIANNANVEFNQAGAGTYSGAMSGNCSLTKSGAGAVTLSGNNTYSGGTTVSAGSLVGTTSSLQGNIVNNAAVTFSQATSGRTRLNSSAIISVTAGTSHIRI